MYYIEIDSFQDPRNIHLCGRIDSFQDPYRYVTETDFFTDSPKKGEEHQTPHNDFWHPGEDTALEQNDTRGNTQTAHNSSSTAFCTYTLVTLKLLKSNTVFISLGANNVNVKPK